MHLPATIGYLKLTHAKKGFHLLLDMKWLKRVPLGQIPDLVVNECAGWVFNQGLYHAAEYAIEVSLEHVGLGPREELV